MKKRIILYYLSNILEKTPKCYTKNIEKDTISDLAYCDSSKLIAVALKNSKEIIFYELKKQEANKFKIEKIETKRIISDQKYEINKLDMTKDGNYLSTSGINEDDTKVHVYDVKTCKLIESLEINQFQNIDLKFSPDDRFLTVSTFMHEVAVIEFKTSYKHNKNSNQEEISTKIALKKSIGIKVPILNYDFSNDSNFFALSTDDGKIKIYQSFAPGYNLEDSKVIKEIDVEFDDEEVLPRANKVSLYIIEAEKNDFEGVLACSYEKEILVFNLKGNLMTYIPNANDSEIVRLKIVKDTLSRNARDIFILSSGKDGKINIYKVFN